MKLIVAIVQDYDTDRLLHALTVNRIGATKLASTGGFLRTGNTTVLMGVDDDRVARILQLIQQSCNQRAEVQVELGGHEFAEWQAGGLHEVTIGGAVVFVMNITRFEQFPFLDEA